MIYTMDYSKFNCYSTSNCNHRLQSFILLCDSEKSCWLLFVTYFRMCQYGDKERSSTRNCTIAFYY